MKKSIFVFAAAMCFFSSVWCANANTTRHIYNYSTCTLEFRVDTIAGNFYSNGGKNLFSVPPQTQMRYVVTTTRAISRGTVYVKGVGKDGSFVMEYFFSEGAMKYPIGAAMKWLSGGGPDGEISVRDCGKVRIEVNSPASGDMKIVNFTPSHGGQGSKVEEPSGSAY